MPITPADIQQKTFPEARRGYEPTKVDEFLEEISTDIDAMLRKIADLKTRLTAAEGKNAELVNQLEAAKSAAAKAQQAAAAAQATVASPAPVAAPQAKSGIYSATEEQLSAALIAAQQTAERIVGEAKTSAERIRSDAENQARKVIRQALDEKQAELDEIERLKKSREDFRSEYMGLLQKFVDAAQTNFPASMLAGSSSAQVTAPTAAPLPRTTVAPLQSVTPYGAQVDANTVDDLD